jgi:hypothetical protein
MMTSGRTPGVAGGFEGLTDGRLPLAGANGRVFFAGAEL